MNKEECEFSGGEWVNGYKRRGLWVRSFCRHEKSRTEVAPFRENLMEMKSGVKDLPSTYEKPDMMFSSASKNVKLPRSNTMNARRTYSSLKLEEKHLGLDLRKQNYEGAVYQSQRISNDAHKEEDETSRLSSSQKIKAEENYERQKHHIVKRELKETKSKIHKEKKVKEKARKLSKLLDKQGDSE